MIYNDNQDVWDKILGQWFGTKYWKHGIGNLSCDIGCWYVIEWIY